MGWGGAGGRVGMRDREGAEEVFQKIIFIVSLLDIHHENMPI